MTIAQRAWRMISAVGPALLFAGCSSTSIADADWPDFLSEDALQGLERDAERGPAPLSISGQRERADSIQQEVGRARLARFEVQMTEDVIAGVPVRIFTPKDYDPSSPILLNLHGGGFIVDSGSITENAPLAGLTSFKVIAVRYRLSPENPFPAARDDALAVWRAVGAQGTSKKIGLYGTSAGAILSAQLLAKLSAEGERLPDAVGFFSGTADFAQTDDTLALFGDPTTFGLMTRLYARGQSLSDPQISPARGDLQNWPDTLCISSSRDVFLSSTANFCRALEEAGASAQLTVYDGLPHAFWSYIDAPETDAAFNRMARFFIDELGE